MEQASPITSPPLIICPLSLHEKHNQAMEVDVTNSTENTNVDKYDKLFGSDTLSSVSSFSHGGNEFKPFCPLVPSKDPESSLGSVTAETVEEVDAELPPIESKGKIPRRSLDSDDGYAQHGPPCAGSICHCCHSWYGSPLSPEHLKKLMPRGDGGLEFHAKIVPEDIYYEEKVHYLKQSEFDFEKKDIKSRRASLPVKSTDFFSSLVRIDDDDKDSDGPRWVFSGCFNGWPGLTCLELIDLRVHKLRVLWSTIWSARRQGKQGILPHIPQNGTVVRATLRAVSWSSRGWSADSPGFVFWFESQRTDQPRILHGTNIVNQTKIERNISLCTHVHMMSHRYAENRPETQRDKLTYHSVVLLEWDHGRYTTVVETAWQNGVCGRGGKSNWIEDRDESATSLYQACPPELILPWNNTASEIRCIDMPVTNLDEFKQFARRHTGPEGRFLDPHFTFSHRVRLTFRSKVHISQYLLNYIGRDWTYSEIRRNCQTFAADFCGFLAGKRGVEPFHPVNRIKYKNRSDYFLYESDMYDKASDLGEKRGSLIGFEY